MIFILSKDVLKKCGEFSHKRIWGSHKLYKQRGETNIAKIQDDIYAGALAEFAVYNYLKMDNRDCTEPDLEIYASNAKNYSPDLISEDLKIHVKSQTAESAERWGLSWSFQRVDPLIKMPTEKDYIALCKVHGNVVELIGVVKAETVLQEHLFAECRNLKYAKTKQVIYYDELAASKINLWEL